MYSNEVPPFLISHIQHVTTHCSCLCRAMKKIQTECLPVFTVNQKQHIHLQLLIGNPMNCFIYSERQRLMFAHTQWYSMFEWGKYCPS